MALLKPGVCLAEWLRDNPVLSLENRDITLGNFRFYVDVNSQFEEHGLCIQSH